MIVMLKMRWKSLSGKEKSGPSRDRFNPYWSAINTMIKINNMFTLVKLHCQMMMFIVIGKQFSGNMRAIYDYPLLLDYLCGLFESSPESKILNLSAENSQNLWNWYHYFVLLTHYLRSNLKNTSNFCNDYTFRHVIACFDIFVILSKYIIVEQFYFHKVSLTISRILYWWRNQFTIMCRWYFCIWRPRLKWSVLFCVLAFWNILAVPCML